MPVLSFLQNTKLSPEDEYINTMNLIETEIEKIKKDGKYKQENLLLTHADFQEGASPWQHSDPRYPAKFNVLNALKDYMSSDRTPEDLTRLDAVIHDPDNKDYDKGGVFGHSTTLQLVWKVRDNFPPISSISGIKKQCG